MSSSQISAPRGSLPSQNRFQKNVFLLKNGYQGDLWADKAPPEKKKEPEKKLLSWCPSTFAKIVALQGVSVGSFC